MRNSTKVIVVIILLILENIALVYILDFYRQGKTYQELLDRNKGLTQDCKNLTLSDSLFSVLEKMKRYSPYVSFLQEKIHLSYGDEWAGNPGVGLLFDKGYKLVSKACNSSWEPSVPDLPVTIQ